LPDHLDSAISDPDQAAHDGSLRAGDAAARDVAERWEQFTNYLCLSLSQELGATVTGYRPRGQATEGEVTSTLRVPDAVGPVKIRTELRSRQTFVSVSIDAPRDGRVKARFNWLLRQVREAPDDLIVEASFPNARTTTAAKLAEVREDPAPCITRRT
jgi:hypothetical protein